MNRVRFTESAEREIDLAWTWYEEQSVGLGSRLLDDIPDARNRIAAFPRAWPQLGDGVRRFTLRHFPYGLVYIATEDEVIVVGLGHLHRGPEFWQSMTRRRD